MVIVMATVKRRGQFRQHEPYATRDLNWYMDWKIDGYIQYLDEIDPVGIYTLEYDTDIPTKEELLNGIDQNHIQMYNASTRVIDKEEEVDDVEEIIAKQLKIKEQNKALKKILEKKAEEEHQTYLRRRATWDERNKALAEIKKQKEEKEKYKKLDREYIKKYYKEFGMEGLNTLYQDSVFKISQLRLMIIASDVIVEADIELQEAYQYRQEYVEKLIEHERQKLKDNDGSLY